MKWVGLMRRRWVIGLLLVLAACNLETASAPTATPQIIPSPVLPGTTIPTPTRNLGTPTSGIQLTPNTAGLVTRLPNSGATDAPIANAQTLGQTCQVYLVYSGADPANVISMRARPSADAPLVIRVPNNARVFLVPNAQEVAMEGYHWLNILYVDAGQNRYQGWAARDSFMQAGIRDTSIATLRGTGEQAPC